MIQKENHIFQGLRRDNHPIRQDAKFLWDALNVRLTNRNDSTLLSITNEKGTKPTGLSLEGKYVGHCVLNEYLIVFATTGEKDYIYRIEKRDNSYEKTVLYGAWPRNTSLGFDVNYPIEALGDYESDLVQKVYWTDGKHQPRVINIKEGELKGEINSSQVYAGYISTSFDFVPTLKLEEEVEVTKCYDDGMFSPGTIQYAFTYYNKYGQESNIFYTTPLYYISPRDRGGDPEERVQNTFRIKIKGWDYKFDYIRVYSIHRTSIDAVPVVRRVGDIKAFVSTDGNDTIHFTDTGTIGDTVDPMKLLYIGGEEIVASTMCGKDGTLFLGNIELKRISMLSSDKNAPDMTSLEIVPDVKYTDKTDYSYKNNYYKYDASIDMYDAYFKSGEWYRLGLQFQHKTGRWSDPIFIADKQMPSSIRPSDNIRPIFKVSLLKDMLDYFIDKDYKKVRGVMVQPSSYDRTIIAQGIVCPTVFNIRNRVNNTPFVQSSWFIRPNLPYSFSSEDNNTDVTEGAVVQYRHLGSLFPNTNMGGELQCTMISPRSEDVFSAVHSDPDNSTYDNIFMVDQSIVTFHSPDIEWNDSVKILLKEGEYKIRLVGVSLFTSNISDIDIKTSTPVAGLNTKGFVHQQIGNTSDGSKGLVSGLFYKDSIITKNEGGEYSSVGEYSYMVYPWNKTGSLNNDENRISTAGVRTAELSTKVISNLRFSKENKWFNPDKYWEMDSTKVQLFDSNVMSLLKIDAPTSFKFEKLNYFGNVDMAVPKSSSPSMIELNGSIQTVPTSLGDGYDPPLNGISGAIRMKYKSSPHAVFTVNKNDSSSFLPVVGNSGVRFSVNPFWVDTDPGTTTDKIITVDYFRTENIPDPRQGQYRVKSIENGYEQIQKYIVQDGIGKWEIDMEHVNKDVYFHFNIDDIYWREVPYGPHQRAERVNLKLTMEQEELGLSDIESPYLYIAEIYKDKPDNMFGGDTDEAKQSNLWVPASKPYSIENTIEDVSIEFEFGDTWYQRYDCLKTYPFTQEDENQVVEIASFMCESRVNSNGRYDKNRGQLSNLNMSPLNFNMMNEIYSQKDNFFDFRILDKDLHKQAVFNNQVTWSLEKTPFSEVDPWTNITLSNTLNMPGNKGSITAIREWNRNLLCFQQHSLSKIMFNNRVQIPVSDGVPVEISNGYKVDGSVEIAPDIGCVNKWSIGSSSRGCYFIDSNTRSIYLFNGELTNISSANGMNWWVKESNPESKWVPYISDTPGVRTFIDNSNEDIYFSPGLSSDTKDSLCFSNVLGQFTSLMSYGGIQAMFNYSTGFYSLNGEQNSNGEDIITLYENFKGNYNDFYGTTKGWYFSFISNESPSITKVFDNVEFRADSYSTDTRLLKQCPFNYMKVENEYQSAKTDVNNMNMRKKFRAWRGLLPRSSEVALPDPSHFAQNGNDISRKYGRARIRNPWAMITLGWKPVNNNDTDSNSRVAVIHDVSVGYTV